MSFQIESLLVEKGERERERGERDIMLLVCFGGGKGKFSFPSIKSLILRIRFIIKAGLLLKKKCSISIHSLLLL
jgi:hypothetical protein